jgi:hypothetical protein
MRRVVAKKMDFGRRNAMIIARINLLGVDSPVLSPFAPSGASNTVPEDAIEQMRRELEAAYGPKLADEAWTEIVAHIDALYRLDEFEVGNFDSPLERPSDPNGLPEPSDDIVTSGGSSTTSDIEAPPADVSATITDKSSGSISDSAEPTSKPSQTDEA